MEIKNISLFIIIIIIIKHYINNYKYIIYPKNKEMM